MSSKLRVGMVAPYSARATVAATSDFPTEDIQAASFEVTKPNGTHASWPATILSKTSGAISIRHVFEAGDLDLIGTFRIWAAFTTSAPGEILRTDPVHISVLAADQ